MVHVPKAFEPEPHKLPIETDHTREVGGPSPYGPAPLSAVQRDTSQPVGPGPTRYPEMPIPDASPLRVGEFDPQAFVTLKARREAILGPSPTTQPQASELQTRIAHALNAVSAENGSDTPDFILAEYLVLCLRTFDLAVSMRDQWYGRGRSTQGLGPAPQSAPDPVGVPGNPNVRSEQDEADPTDEINDLA